MEEKSVMQIADINLLTLPSLPLEQRSQLPTTPCIYFAIDFQDQVQYIGRATNAKLRWGCHHQYSKLQAMGDVKIAYLLINERRLLPQIEQALIDWFQPPLNVNRRITLAIPVGSAEGHLLNRIQEFGKEKGIPSANKFWQATELPRATAFRLWRDRSIYPDRGTVEVICKKLKAQPGDFLVYIESAEGD